MPLKDTLKGITKEFDSIRQDLSKIIQPGHSQNQNQNQYGYGQQQGHGHGQQGFGQQQGGYPGQQQQHGGYSGQQQGGYGHQQHGVNPPNQGYNPPSQQQYQQPGQPAQHQSQYQNPGQPPQPQWQGGGYGQPQQYPQQYGQGQQQQYPPPPGQQNQQYGQPASQHPASPPPQYGSLPPSQGQQQQHFGAPPVPFGSHPTTPQPPQSLSPQPPQAHLQSQQYGQPPLPHQQYVAASPPPQHTQGHPPQQPIGHPGIYWHANFNPSIPVSHEWEHKEGNNNGWGNAELQNYTSTPSNSFYTGDGKLVLRAVSQAGQHTSARLVSRQRLSRPRGCLTAWLTSPCASGVWPAFWLLPAEPFNWPNDGEVDIAETWNGDCQNHTCLHWGSYTPQDAWKHRVVGTHIPDMAQRPVKYEFAWDQNEQNGQGRLMWWIDGRPAMKAPIPDGARKMRDFQVIINIAMGGNVCAGQRPRDGAYDFVVHEVSMRDEPEGGWGRFEQSWLAAREGDMM